MGATATIGGRARRLLRLGAVALAALLPATALAVAQAPAPAVAATSGWLHTEGAAIKTEAGQTYTIKAVAWFGMETSNCAPHGLWSISLDAGLASIASMGFNTIRLPFSNECLAQASSTSINQNANPDLVSLTPLQLMDTVIAKARSYGLNVILDRHRPDSGAQSELWYTDRYSEKQWIADWTMLASRYKSDPTVIGVDLHNEPHGQACWGCGDPARDWQAAATRAGDAVLAANPKLLIVVEGVDRQGDGSSTWWGGGLSDAGAKPVSLKVAGRVVYSPHDYPSTVFNQTWFQAADYPANLEGVWERNWGYLVTKGVAPVLLGEFGTKYESASDQAWLKSLVGYLGKKGISFAYWSFNPNSGDTGGLVTDDWTTKQSAKLEALAPLLGPGGTVTPSPTATPKPTATPTPKPTATPTPTPKPTATPTPTPKPTATPSPTPKPTATPTPTPKPTTPPTGTPVSGKWTLQSSWGEGYVAEIELTAAAKTAGWTVTWPDTAATSVVNSWGMDCTVKPKTSITCTGKDWAGPLQPDQTVRVGLQVAAPKAPASPKLTITAR